MAELTIDAIALAVAENPDYRPVSALDEEEPMRVIAGVVAGIRGVPVERLAALAGEYGDADLALLALAELGPPPEPEPLYLVQPHADVDPFVAELPRLVHRLEWTVTEDIGVTHLDELGGTEVFAMLDWALPAGTGATVVVVDRPPIVERPQPLRVLALRVRNGEGPLRVLGYEEGAADHIFTGRGACDAWASLHSGLSSGLVRDGDRVLLHTRGTDREGWLLLTVTDAKGIGVRRCVHYGR